MTWWRDTEHYEVFFNRDELKTRATATPPRLLETGSGVRFLAPIDPTAGGTWMLVNERRVTVCLLNHWQQSALCHGSFKSRGLLVTSMADALSARDVIHQLRQLRHSEYKPFTLVALDPDETLGAAWDGRLLSDESLSLPLTSSSYCFAEVAAARRRVFAQIADKTPEHLKKYHAGESPASAYTVRMNRSNAQTWSRSHLRVGMNSMSWEYIEESPSLTDNGILYHVSLPLQRS